LFDAGHNRKTDALDAHSIAIVAVRTKTLRVLAADGELEALRMLSDRRDELTHLRVQTMNRLQRLLTELIPGQRTKDLTALQAKAMLARSDRVTSPGRPDAASPPRSSPNSSPSRIRSRSPPPS
jgi:transposase